MANFPSGICFLVEDYKENYDYALLRTDMESGWAKQRPRRSKPVVTRTGTLVIDGYDKYREFKNFLANIGGGSGQFDWIDPLDKQSKTVRFANQNFEFALIDVELGIFTASATIEGV